MSRLSEVKTVTMVRRREIDSGAGNDLQASVIILTVIYAIFLLAIIALNLGWL